VLRFHVPLIEPDVRICRIRLSEKDFMLSPTGVSRPAHGVLAVEAITIRRMGPPWGEDMVSRAAARHGEQHAGG